MAVFRETPYSAFNYLVELEPGQGTEVIAGFAEVAGLSSEITVAEHRFGNAATNYVTKIPGIYKAGDVTLKRGLIGAENLWDWLEETRNGLLSAKRNIEIKLQNESRSEVVVTWKLVNSFPMKWTGPSLTAKGRRRRRHGRTHPLRRGSSAELIAGQTSMLTLDDTVFSPGRISLRPNAPPPRPASIEAVMLGHCPGAADWRQLFAMPALVAQIEDLGFTRQIRALRALDARGGLIQGEADRRLMSLESLPIPITSPTQFNALFPEARLIRTIRQSRLAGAAAWLPLAVDDYFARSEEETERTLWLIKLSEKDGIEGFLPRIDADWFSTDPYEALGPFEMACLPPRAGFVAFPDLERLQVPARLADIAVLDQPKLEPGFLPCDEDLPAETPTVLVTSDEPSPPIAFARVLSGIAESGRRLRPDLHFLLTVPLAPEGVVDRGYPAPSAEALVASDSLRGHLAEAGLAQIQLLYPYLRSPDRPLASPVGIIAGRMVASTVRNGAWASIAGRPLSRLQQAYPPQTPQQIRALRDEHGIGVLGSDNSVLELDDERLARPSFLTRSAVGSGEVARFLGWLRRELRQFGERLIFVTDPDDPRPAMALDALFRKLYASGALAGRVPEESFSIHQRSNGEGSLIFEIGINAALPIDRIHITFAEDRLDFGIANREGR